MNALRRSRRPSRSKRVLNVALVAALLGTGGLHAFYLCYGAGDRGAVGGANEPTARAGGCHDAPPSSDGPARETDSSPSCCASGVLAATLPFSEDLASGAAAGAGHDAATTPALLGLVGTQEVLVRCVRRHHGESPFRGLRSHLAYHTLLI